MPDEVAPQTVNPPVDNSRTIQSQRHIDNNNNDSNGSNINTSVNTNESTSSSTNFNSTSVSSINNSPSIDNQSNISKNSDVSSTMATLSPKSAKSRVTKLNDSNKLLKKKGKPGRPRIHNDSNGLVADPHKHQDGNSVSVNEVIPKVWVISNFSVPFMAQIAIEVLKKGDKVVLGCCPGGEGELKLLKQANRLRQRYPDRCIVVELDIKNYALCQSTISKTINQYGRIDVVVNCTNRIYVGALKEVEEWHMRAQLDQTFYGAVNIIQAALPYMRKQFFGHFVNITDVTGNIGTPALSLLSGAMHAIEGYLEALACEVAPFNIKVTIVESPMEVSLLTIPVVLAEELPQYGPDTPAGKLRSLLTSSNVFPEQAFRNTILTVVSLGGLENPPGRIVVGKEAIGQIKDKLALLSEDLEEFSAVSISADYEDYHIF